MTRIQSLAGKAQWRYLAAVILVVCLAVAGVAIAASGGSSVPPTEKLPGKPAMSHEVAQQVSADGVALSPAEVDVRAFSVLRRPHSSIDVLPADIHVSFSRQSGANVSLARRAQSPGGTAWLVPGSGTMCLVTQSAVNPKNNGAGCVPASTAAGGDLKMEEFGRTTANKMNEATDFVSGLVPDGVSEVTLHLTGGGSIVVPVHENVYMQEVRGRVPTVTFDGPNGPVTVGAGG